MKCEQIRGSNLDWFSKCQLNFRYTVHERMLPPILIPRWSVFGWVAHKAAELAIRENLRFSSAFEMCASDYKSIVKEEVASTWPDHVLRESEIPGIEMRSLERSIPMARHFDMFIPSFLEDADQVLLEKPFTIDLDPDSRMLYVGRRDLMVRKGDRWYIFDWKTTIPSYEYKTVPPQLGRYAMATAIECDIPINSICTVLFNLESGNMPKRIWNAREGNAMIDDLIATVTKIRSMDPGDAKPTVGSHCDKLCQYHPLCHAWRTSSAKKHFR
jgi:hypothetical protein